MLISSPHNQRISLIRNLSGAKARRRTGLYFIEGIGLVARAVAAKSPLETLVVCERLCQSDFGRKLLDDAHAAGLPRLDVSADLFITLAEDRSHGVAAIARQQWSLLGEVNVTPEHSWIALDAIQYPPNLGMILRTADAAGYTGIILLDNSTDPYSSAAVRASRGAVFSQSLVRATLADFADWKRSHPDIHLVGTSPAATTDYRQAPYIPPMVLLMGTPSVVRRIGTHSDGWPV